MQTFSALDVRSHQRGQFSSLTFAILHTEFCSTKPENSMIFSILLSKKFQREAWMAVLFNDLHSSAHWLTRTRAPAGAGAACQRLGHRIGESANRRVSESANQVNLPTSLQRWVQSAKLSLKLLWTLKVWSWTTERHPIHRGVANQCEASLSLSHFSSLKFLELPSLFSSFFSIRHRVLTPSVRSFLTGISA